MMRNKKIIGSAIASLLLTSTMTYQPAEAKGSVGGGRASSSAASSASRSASTNAARSASISAARAASASRMSSTVASRTSTTRNNSKNRFSSKTRSLSYPVRRNGSSSFMYNYYNSMLIYYLIMHNHHDLDMQWDYLKRQSKKVKRTFYVVTVQTNDGERQMVVSKSDYDHIKNGDEVVYKNNRIQVKGK